MLPSVLHRDSSAITPTAHYTGQVWARNGLSHPELETREGKLMFEALQPLMAVAGLLGGPTLEGYLLARHRALDELLRRAIEDDGITQVLEIACGMSARGWRFVQRYGSSGLTYVEADLPDMAARKRNALASMGSLGAGHRVVAIDALAKSGSLSLNAVASELDTSQGLVIICEGLLGYLSRADVEGLWKRMASVLKTFSAGAHLTDLHLAGAEPGPLVHGFRLGLSAFVRGRVHLHFESEADAIRSLRLAGFSSWQITPASAVDVGGNGIERPGAGGRLSTVVVTRV
jgi:O-methyltransferase involved in polyketide biosynthesis